MTQPPNQPTHQFPYPGQQQLPPPGFIRIHARHKISTSWVPPTIAIDGHLVAMNQGMQVVPVVPGPHVVTGHGQWMWKYGKAELRVQVAQGQTVDVFYALPVLTFVKGAIGFVPVKAPGKLMLALFLLAVMGGVAALVIVAALLGS